MMELDLRIHQASSNFGIYNSYEILSIKWIIGIWDLIIVLLNCCLRSSNSIKLIFSPMLIEEMLMLNITNMIYE